MKAYHGSNSIFRKFDHSKARIFNDFYGGGIAYFTDNLDVAKTYARNMSKKFGEPIVYEVDLNFRKLFDVDETFSEDFLILILQYDDVENFARGAGLMKLGGESKFVTIGRLKEGKINLTGDQVFRGLSRGMNQTARARKILMELGYDGLRYNGGLNMGMATKHSVYLAYRENNIKITRVFRIIKSTSMKEEALPSKRLEKWIKSNKKRFKSEYGEKEGEKILYAKAWKMHKEDAPVNNIGSGNIAGAPPDLPGVSTSNSKNKLSNTTLIRRRRMGNDEFGEEIEYDTGTFGGHAYFTVSDDCFYKCRLGKKNQEHYKTYVGDDEIGQKIRTYGYENPGKPIIVRNDKTGAMMFLRYGKK